MGAVNREGPRLCFSGQDRACNSGEERHWLCKTGGKIQKGGGDSVDESAETSIYLINIC